MAEENQEIILRLGMFEQQLQQLQQQLQSVEREITELKSLHLGLEEIPNSKDKEVLARISSGIYAKAKIISDELIVNIGENSFVKKNIPETKKIIEEQVEKLKIIEGQIEEGIELTNNEFLRMIQEYQDKQKGKE